MSQMSRRSSFRYLKFLAALGAVLGHFPVRSLRKGIFQRKFQSTFGVWCLFLMVIQLIGMQNSFLCIAIQTEVFAGSHSIFQVGGVLLPGMSYVYGNNMAMYLVYVFWLWSLPKFLNTWKSLENYDEKYCLRNIRISYPEFLLKLARTGVFLLEISITTAAFKMNVLDIYKHTSWEKVRDSSWVARNFGIQTMSWFVGIHISVCQFSSGLAIQFILELCNGLRQRMDILQQSIQAPKMSNTISQVYSQITDLLDIFNMLQEAINLIVLAFLSCGTVLITMYIYIIVVNVSQIESRPDYVYFILYMTLYLGFTVFKVVMLANTGESLQKQVIGVLGTFRFNLNHLITHKCAFCMQGNRLRSAILRISTDSVALCEHARLSDLKLLSLDANFPLSGDGFFRLNRAALTGVNFPN